MALPPECRDFGNRNEGDIQPKDKSLLDVTIDKITTKNSKNLLYARPSAPLTLPPTTEADRPLETILPQTQDPFKPTEVATFEKPAFLPPKALSHSPKISPSSIPNPSPSVTANKAMDPGYSNYGGYLYSIPGYSAFQPLSYPGMLPPQPPMPTNDFNSASDFNAFPPVPKDNPEDKNTEAKSNEAQTLKAELSKAQTDFEDQFTTEVVPAISVQECKSLTESKMSITSLAQGSGATVTIPSQVNKDTKKKPPERFSLKTSIPISKIDMKCVNNPPEPIISNAMAKKTTTPFNPAFQNTKTDLASKVEIQSNIIIKSALKEPEVESKQVTPTSTNINTLIDAAEAVSKNDSLFRKPEPKNEVINEIKDPPPQFLPPTSSSNRPVFNPMNPETGKANFPPKPPDGNFNEQKNQILFIQNKNQNPKMLLTIQQQNPQVLLQRTNFESKNVQVPSRLSSQSKKCKDDAIENGTSSKVVALKRLHQENCDENDFENLITENQIYGNKIVVKEKSQGTLQEQDLKNKKVDKTQEPKNVVLQPNFLYLSNVQFPANLMMIKNSTKITPTSESNKISKVTSNENKVTNEASTMTNNTEMNTTKNVKQQNVSVSKEIHVLKSSNNVLQTLCNKNSKTDLVFQTSHQKVIMNPQIVYQVSTIVDTDHKLNQPMINRDYSKFIGPNKKEYPKQFDQKPNDKLYIACPYQMDSKLQPKIVITNIRPKINKIDEVSSLDIYEKRRRMRRLKYLSNRDTKDYPKVESKKLIEKIDVQRNIITPDRMKDEICKEFTNTKVRVEEGSSDSESDYGEEDLIEYDSIIKCFGHIKEDDSGKADFLANFRLGTHVVYKERELDRRERILRRDSVASAYIAAGRLDKLTHEDNLPSSPDWREKQIVRAERREETERGVTLQMKQMFLSQLRLTQVTTKYKEDYERTWKEIMKERKRRNGTAESKQILKQPKLKTENLELDSNSQLQILTEIKKSVNENNNLIKKRMDCLDNENVTAGDSIHTLAEKNFSELDRLSKMADMSVKLITGQDARKRDLNPGFDSENIKKPPVKVEQPFQNYPYINIPNISKIISLKTQDSQGCPAMTTQATSMDEPVNSAAGVESSDEGRTKEFSCQVEETFAWPGLEAVAKSYREFEAARKRELSELRRLHTSLRVSGAHLTRYAAREADTARALLAERQRLAREEGDVRQALRDIIAAVHAVRNY